MYAPITGVGSGIAPVVNLTFEYLDQAHVKAAVNGAEVPFTWTGVSQITFDSAVAADANWMVYRDTSISLPMVDFMDSSVLTEEDLDTAHNQLRYHQEEIDARYGTLADADVSASAAASSAAAAASSAVAADNSADIAQTAANQAAAAVVLPAASVPVASRMAMSLLDTDFPAVLSEGNREGIFTFSEADLSAAVAADPEQGVYVARVGDPTGATGAWVRRYEGGVRPEWFGAMGDGVTDDSAALYATSQFINAQGGGEVNLRTNAVYMVGGQTSQDPPLNVYYTFPPNFAYPLHFVGNSRTVIVRGNGATIRALPGSRYGTFNPDGSPLATSAPYYGVGASTPYYAMLHFEDNVGVHVENLELDGNLPNLNVNGVWGDTGIQLSAVGINLFENEGPIYINNVNSHHHALDGLQVKGLATTDTAPRENGEVVNSRFEMNARQGLSFVGGKGWTFRNSKFNWTGKAAAGSDTLGVQTTQPAAGVDLEAEGGKIIRDVTFDNCEFIGSYGAGFLVPFDHTQRVLVKNSTLIGTSNYAVWIMGKGVKFEDSLIAGSIAYVYAGGTGAAETSFEATQFDKCDFTNANSISPTGTVFAINGLIFESANAEVAVRNSRLVHDRPGAGGANNYDGIRFTDSEFWALQGGGNFYGRFRGKNLFVNTGAVPGAMIVGRADAGHSEGPWVYRTLAGVETTYGPTLDAVGNRPTSAVPGYDVDLALTPGTTPQTFLDAYPLTADRLRTVPNTTFDGAKFRFVRLPGSTGAFNLSVQTVGGTVITTLATGEWAEVEYINASAGWQVVAAGTL